MKFVIRVVCSQMRDTSTSLLLMCDNSVVLVINVCDGWQRQAGTAKLKMVTCNNVLLSSLDADSTGGFPGFYLTANDSAKDKSGFACKMYGPKGLGKYCGSLALDAYPKLWDAVEIDGEEPHGKEEEEEKKKTNQGPYEVDGKVQVFPIVVKAEKEAISYFIRPLPTKPKFKGNDAKKLGLTVDQIKTLVAGKPVTAADGKVITPESMHNPPEQPASLLVLFVPTAAHIESLLKSPQLAKIAPESLGLVYHSAPLSVLQDPRYLDLIARLGPNAAHVVDCKDMNDDIAPRYTSQVFVQQLGAISSRIFPVAPLQPIHRADQGKRSAFSKECEKRKLKQIYYVEVGKDYGVWPGKDVSKTSVMPGLHQKGADSAAVKSIEEIAAAISEKPELKTVYELCTRLVPTRTFKNEPTFVILGTASQKPLKYRCVSGIYVNLPGSLEGKVPRGNGLEYYSNSFGMMLDCGEGSYGQLLDHFADPGIVDAVINNIKLIYISHYHGDHTFGLSKFLLECDLALQRKHGRTKEAQAIISKDHELLLLVPENFRKTAEHMIQANNLAFPGRIRLVETERLNPDPELHFGEGPAYVPPKKLDEATVAKYIEMLYHNAAENVKSMWEFAQKHLGLARLHTFSTDHCAGSHGLVMEGGNWRVVYGGDTAVCQTLENFSKHSDLLIHECTFSDNVPRKEEDIKHTTLDQCLRVFDALAPWRMLMTHFSNKSIKIVNLTPEHVKRKIFTAFDHLQFRLSDAEWISELTPLFEGLITNE